MSEKAKKATTGRRSQTARATTMVAPPKCKLLISVHTADEAGLALEGGADLIDVKEPAKGSLGMAHHETVAGVLEVVNGRVPVSAALGEWSEKILTEAHWHLELPLTYVKWGLKGYIGGPGWGEDLLQTRREIPASMEVVATAYADWEKAQSVQPLEVARFAKRFRYKAFLLDTYQKDGRTLLDFLKPAEVIELIDSLKRGGVIVALGGSLKPEQVKLLGDTLPDYFAVRGSVCVGGKRDAELDPVRMKKWKDTLS
jgi:(5-formylfuran-3-yl)methyl phosphate synthase